MSSGVNCKNWAWILSGDASRISCRRSERNFTENLILEVSIIVYKIEANERRDARRVSYGTRSVTMGHRLVTSDLSQIVPIFKTAPYKAVRWRPSLMFWQIPHPLQIFDHLYRSLYEGPPGYLPLEWSVNGLLEVVHCLFANLPISQRDPCTVKESYLRHFHYSLCLPTRTTFTK